MIMLNHGEQAPVEHYGDQPDVLVLGKLKAGSTLTEAKLADMMEKHQNLTMEQLKEVWAEMDDIKPDPPWPEPEEGA